MSRLVASAFLPSKTTTIAFFSIAISIFSIAVPANAKLIYDKKIFEIFAADLMNGLEEATMDEVSRISNQGRLSVEIEPMRLKIRGNGLVTPDAANELNAFLLATLMRKSRTKFRFQINQSNDRARIRNCRPMAKSYKCGLAAERYDAALVKPDIIISGRLVINGRGGSLSYLAFAPETGLILAASTPQKIIATNAGHPQRNMRRPWLKYRNNDEYLDPVRYQIFHLQRSLRRLGYRPGKENGYLTPKTRNAIRSYQWHHELFVTGIASPKLLKHVDDLIALGSSYRG